MSLNREISQLSRNLKVHLMEQLRSAQGVTLSDIRKVILGKVTGDYTQANQTRMYILKPVVYCRTVELLHDVFSNPNNPYWNLTSQYKKLRGGV